jgi:hypothetical protein
MCDRCKEKVKHASRTLHGSVGYYEVDAGWWHRFSNEGEKYVCDECMFKDERYIAVYGRHSDSKGE